MRRAMEMVSIEHPWNEDSARDWWTKHDAADSGTEPNTSGHHRDEESISQVTVNVDVRRHHGLSPVDADAT